MELRPLPHPDDYKGKPDYQTLRRLICNYRTFVGDDAAFRLEFRVWPGEFQTEAQREQFVDREMEECPTSYEDIDNICDDLSKELNLMKGISKSLTLSLVDEMTRKKEGRHVVILLLVIFLLAITAWIFFGMPA